MKVRKTNVVLVLLFLVTVLPLGFSAYMFVELRTLRDFQSQKHQLLDDAILNASSALGNSQEGRARIDGVGELRTIAARLRADDQSEFVIAKSTLKFAIGVSVLQLMLVAALYSNVRKSSTRD